MLGEDPSLSDVTKTGRASFFVRHENAQWHRDGQVYRFPTINERGLSISRTKRSDGFLEIELNGALNRRFRFRHPTPIPGIKGVHVAISWGSEGVKFYLNGEMIEKREP